MGEFFVEQTGRTHRLRVVESAAARRDRAWNGLVEIDAFREVNASGLHKFPRAGRTLRTPTFTLTTGALNYELRGGCRVFVCVDSYRMTQGPLHGETMIDVAPDEGNSRRWVRHDLQRHIGHRVHVEFTTRGDDPLEIYRVVDGEVDRAVARAAGEIDADTTIDANAISAGLTALAIRLRSGHALKAHEAAAANWIAGRPSLLVEPGEPAASDFHNAIAWHAKQREQIAAGIVKESRVAMAMQDGSPENEFLLIRGNHDNPGDVVPRRFLAALGGVGPAPEFTGSGRRQLADQIADPVNPLTYRVTVNRVWAHLLGRGVVASPDDFGVLGERPTHPELLDHLTTRFIHEYRGSLKQLIRAIVLSRTFCLSSDLSPTVAEADPQNLLLSRFHVQRLESEAVRDCILAVSGQLDATMFGPPAPIHLTKFMQGRGRPAASGPLDGAGRRSIYLSVRRNFLVPMMTVFDAPPPSTTRGRRNSSNLPAQALMLLNDPFVHEQARHWAQRTIELHDQTDARLNEMFQRAFARKPIQEELQSLQQYIDVRAAEPGAKQIDIWTDVALALFNVKEFTFVF